MSDDSFIRLVIHCYLFIEVFCQYHLVVHELHGQKSTGAFWYISDCFGEYLRKGALSHHLLPQNGQVVGEQLIE